MLRMLLKHQATAATLTAVQTANGCRDAGDFLVLATLERAERATRAAADATGLPRLATMAAAMARDLELERQRARVWVDAEGR